MRKTYITPYKKKFRKKIYSLYLNGVSVLAISYRFDSNIEVIDEIIDIMNEIYDI